MSETPNLHTGENITDGAVTQDDGREADVPAYTPGGQHDTNAGNADSGHDPEVGANVTGTTPIGTPANDAPDLRPVGKDGNPLETPDALGQETTPSEPVDGSTDENE